MDSCCLWKVTCLCLHFCLCIDIQKCVYLDEVAYKLTRIYLVLFLVRSTTNPNDRGMWHVCHHLLLLLLRFLMFTSSRFYPRLDTRKYISLYLFDVQTTITMQWRDVLITTSGPNHSHPIIIISSSMIAFTQRACFVLVLIAATIYQAQATPEEKYGTLFEDANIS